MTAFQLKIMIICLIKNSMQFAVGISLILSCSQYLASSMNTGLSKDEFTAMAIGSSSANSDNLLQSESLWLDDELQVKITKILDHPYSKLRLRYLTNLKLKQTLWFLDEIGKERPISFAVSIIDRRISLMKVLQYRESRGGEIRMQAFTDQFNQIGVKSNSKLDQHIDGITGATMSVTAMKKIARLALMLDVEVRP
ncbi:MAG: hypothetical protein ACI9IA_001052 [Enterobacterales bacterium]|jgi:hypothetical protein